MRKFGLIPCTQWLRVLLNFFFIVWVVALVYGGSVPLLSDHRAFFKFWTQQGLPYPLPRIWFLQWQMFRYYSPQHREPFFEGLGKDGIWIPIDHREIFRYRFDSGLRFERPDVWWSRTQKTRLLHYLCQKYSQQHPEARVGQLRLGRRIWPKRPGEADQEPLAGYRVDRKILSNTRCLPD